MCDCMMEFAVLAQPVVSSRSCCGDNEMSKGRQPVGGRPWTTMYFAPLSNNVCDMKGPVNCNDPIQSYNFFYNYGCFG